MKEENTSTILVSISFIDILMLGYLYPDRDRELTDADSFDKLKEACKGFEYEKMLQQVSDVPSRDKAGDFGGKGNLDGGASQYNATWSIGK